MVDVLLCLTPPHTLVYWQHARRKGVHHENFALDYRVMVIMGRDILFIFFVLISMNLSGCIGIMVMHPATCEKTVQYSTKVDFLKEWGKPDSVITNSKEEETWIYHKKVIWCGVLPCLLICAPLVLPVCEGYDQIDFREESALRHNKRVFVTETLMINFLTSSIDELFAAHIGDACK